MPLLIIVSLQAGDVPWKIVASRTYIGLTLCDGDGTGAIAQTALFTIDPGTSDESLTN